MSLEVRPAAVTDASPLLPDLLPDRWRDGGNRRSFVALRNGEVLGHARGIDNAIHPDSRVLVLEVRPDVADPSEAARALTSAVLAASDRPLHLKVRESMTLERDLVRTFGGVPIQAMPPWRYPVSPELRVWATEHRGRVDSLGPDDAVEVLTLLVRHYVDQHVSWSPADPRALRTALASDVEPGGHDPDRSVLLRRDGRVVAAGLVWPEDPESERVEQEVTLVCKRHGDPAGRADLEACLAGVVDRSPDGAVLLVDSHVTEEVESGMVADVPGPMVDDDGWTVIVALPVDGGPAPIPLPLALLQPSVRWGVEDAGRACPLRGWGSCPGPAA